MADDTPVERSRSWAPPPPPPQPPPEAEKDSGGDPPSSLPTFLLVFGALLNGSAWNTWRSQVTFSIVKLLYYLSAAPFTVFILGPLVKLISHAEPTGYTKNGRIVERDPTGLSAYVSWLKGSILESTRFENELKEDFSQADRQKLDKMVKDATDG